MGSLGHDVNSDQRQPRGLVTSYGRCWFSALLQAIAATITAAAIDYRSDNVSSLAILLRQLIDVDTDGVILSSDGVGSAICEGVGVADGAQAVGGGLIRRMLSGCGLEETLAISDPCWASTAIVSLRRPKNATTTAVAGVKLQWLFGRSGVGLHAIALVKLDGEWWSCDGGVAISLGRRPPADLKSCRVLFKVWRWPTLKAESQVRQPEFHPFHPFHTLRPFHPFHRPRLQFFFHLDAGPRNPRIRPPADAGDGP